MLFLRSSESGTELCAANSGLCVRACVDCRLWTRAPDSAFLLLLASVGCGLQAAEQLPRGAGLVGSRSDQATTKRQASDLPLHARAPVTTRQAARIYACFLLPRIVLFALSTSQHAYDLSSRWECGSDGNLRQRTEDEGRAGLQQALQ